MQGRRNQMQSVDKNKNIYIIKSDQQSETY